MLYPVKWDGSYLHSMNHSCQEGWHRPALSLFLPKFPSIFLASCRKRRALKSSRLRSAAMKAPVGLLSDRTVLRSKMEGPRSDKLREKMCVEMPPVHLRPSAEPDRIQPQFLRKTNSENCAWCLIHSVRYLKIWKEPADYPLPFS